MGCAICAECVSSRGAALQASVAKSYMPPKALSRFAERGAGWGRRARWTFHSGQRQWHAPACHCLSGEARDRLWRSGSRPPISSTHGPSYLVKGVDRPRRQRRIFRRIRRVVKRHALDLRRCATGTRRPDCPRRVGVANQSDTHSRVVLTGRGSRATLAKARLATVARGSCSTRPGSLYRQTSR